jgi:Tfp pilus assembly PilM family ATPase
MVKRSIQTSRAGFTVGIEYDHMSIRSARLSSDGRGSFIVDRLEEMRGDFLEDAGLLDGLRQIKTRLNVSIRDSIVSCLAGKQVYASQLEFRKLGPEEMEQALRLDLRKIVHFEVATSTLDYQILSNDEDSNGGPIDVLVALASNSLLNRHLSIMEKAGLKVSAVDVLPVAVANAIWVWKKDMGQSRPIVAVHVGPQVSTIVIDGESSPFFNRNVQFRADEILSDNPSSPEKEKLTHSLAEEVSRSMLFYEKNSHASSFQELVLLGDYLNGDALSESLRKITGLPVHKMDLPEKMGSIRESNPGRFDLAVALALRGEA